MDVKNFGVNTEDPCQEPSFKESIKPRLYQEVIFNTATKKNTLVVLPTGLGKTMIAMMLAVHRLKQYPDSKVLFLAPTKPLAQQHYASFLSLLNLPEGASGEFIVIFTGSVSPAKRSSLFSKARIIISTPQGLENDIMGGRISLKDISLLIFDEAHRAVGDYSYVFIAEHYHKTASYERILALTASPGSNTGKIAEVCDNLHIEDIEVRSETDDDVAPYVQDVDIDWVEVGLPKSLEDVRSSLKKLFDNRVEQIRKNGHISLPTSQVNKSTILRLQAELHGSLAKGDKDFDLLKSLSLLAEAMKVQHALELIETQGVYALNQYLSQLRSQSLTTKVKATKNLVLDPLFKEVCFRVSDLIKSDEEHPKLREVRRQVLKHLHSNPSAKIIIFTQFRDQAKAIEDTLKRVNVASKIFVGQAKKNGSGLSQKEQKLLIEQFVDGKFPVLIATSVAEEGLDIPKVDLVIFYEPVPSAIRTVQRRGRTGRLERGKVVCLVTKGTRDVGYRWVAFHKERRMYRAIKDIKKNFLLKGGSGQSKSSKKSLMDFTKLSVIVDHREKGSPVMKALIEMGISLDLRQLPVGDFVISDRCVVEYKRVPDFVDSIIDGRLISQLNALKNYSRPLIIIEGPEDIFSQRKVHPNAIRGMLAAIVVGYGIPVISTYSPIDTAELLKAIIKREVSSVSSGSAVPQKPSSPDAQLEFVVSSIPSIGSAIAKPLLRRFKSIKGLVNAESSDLMSVSGVGRKRAEAILDFFSRNYTS